MKRQDSIFQSAPDSRKVCGYEIKKMPIGAFLKASVKMQEIPAQLMDAVFPGEELGQVFTRFQSLNKESFQDILIRAITALPMQIISLFSELSGIPEDALENDERIGLSGLAGMILAWIEVNDLENFTGSVRTISQKVRTLYGERITGSKT